VTTDRRAAGIPRVEAVLAYGLLGLAWFGLILASREWLLVAPVGLLIALHPLFGRRVQLRWGLRGHALLALAALALYQVHPVSAIGGYRFQSAFYSGLLFLWFSVVRLYAPPDPRRLPWLVFLCSVTFGSSAAGLPVYIQSERGWRLLGPQTPSPEVVYAGLTALFGLLALWALRRSGCGRARPQGPRRRFPARLVALGLSYGLLVAITAGGVWTVRTYADDLTDLLVGLGGAGSRVGFSDRARLGSIARLQTGEDRAVALRIFSKAAPGYLRGRAFSRYVRGGWVAGWTERDLELPSGRYVLFGREPPANGAKPALTIYPAARLAGTLFAPLEAAAIDADARSFHVFSPGESLRTKGAGSAAYRVFLDERPVRAEGEVTAYRDLPKDPALVAALDGLLARAGLARGASATEAIRALAHYFQANYRYRLGIRFARGSDPLTQFIQKKRHGHCELFASSGALALRRLGFATRYVTGFVCEERNPVGEDLWIARNRYAHAWIEVFDPARGWQRAELTPAGGVPTPQPESGAGAWWAWLGGAWERLCAWLRALPALLAAGLTAGGRWLLRLGPFLVVGGGVWSVLRRRRRRRVVWRRALPVSPAVAAKRRRYLAIERQLRRHGLGRRPHETLLEYAARLETTPSPAPPWPADPPRAETVAFLRSFGHRRYGPA